MTIAFEVAAAALALACALHMLWRMREGKRAGCLPAGRDPASELADRQRALAEDIEALARLDGTRVRH